MLAAQSHRGPDGAGLAACGRELPWQVSYGRTCQHLPAPDDRRIDCVLGHNLLAIQDPTDSARQPMLSGELALVFNGEIYNFIELREELVRDGATFRSDGDTEVLLELWKRQGPECLVRLRGMFAFAVYDRSCKTLWLVRDPFGIKPLYYTCTNGELCFASEIRALHAGKGVARKLRPQSALPCAAAGINAFGHGITLYDQVLELPPGHMLIVSDSAHTLQQYAHLPAHVGDLSGSDAIAALRSATEQSVRLHLRARRRIATCLSGGIDSSTVACLIGQTLGDAARDFETFTICTDPSNSELDLAAQVARQAGLRHRIFDPNAISAMDVLEMVLAYEVPNHVIGPINQFLLLREIARSGATVVLDGQGGDELVSGYPWFVPVLLAELRRRGCDTSTLESQLREKLPLDPETARSFDQMFHDPAAWVRSFVWQGTFLGWSPDRLLELPELRWYLHGGGDWREFPEREYLRAELQYLLRQEDRLGMWFGLECRVPLVDRPLVETASRLSPEFLIHDGYLKYPIRAMMPELPDAVRWNTRKRGFWETDREQFPWVCGVGKQLAGDSPCLRELFPTVVDEWHTLSFDQHWRLLQLALLERFSERRDLEKLKVFVH